MRSRHAEGVRVVVALLFVAPACAEERGPGQTDAPAAEGSADVAEASHPTPSVKILPVVHAPAPPARACPERMRLVPGGTLSTLERGRDVTVAPFCMDELEVSVDDWRRCEREGACPALSRRTDWGDPDEDYPASKLCNAGREGAGDHPANCVSLEEASRYCEARAARLPAGDEWEWAARGGKEPGRTPWGSPVATDQICWGKPKKRGGTCPRMSFERDTTPEGLRGMGGNVSEWTRPPRRSGGDPGGARWAYGASWYARDDGYARAALGGFEVPARRAETVGFRCAKDAP